VKYISPIFVPPVCFIGLGIARLCGAHIPWWAIALPAAITAAEIGLIMLSLIALSNE
jgi:hypothetical protein